MAWHALGFSRRGAALPDILPHHEPSVGRDGRRLGTERLDPTDHRRALVGGEHAVEREGDGPGVIERVTVDIAATRAWNEHLHPTSVAAGRFVSTRH